jgi:hypothetical protein
MSGHGNFRHNYNVAPVNDPLINVASSNYAVSMSHSPYTTEDAMSLHNRPHKLTILSLNDAQAHCLCGCWSYVKTGYASKEEVLTQYQLHATREPRTARQGQKAGDHV